MQQLGKVIDKVQLGIDYHIIEHFSKHLYSSPNKAIEELVVNGYDAGAHVVRAFLPGEFTKNLIVWDDGVSMDTNGLKSLWKVADSPKNSDENRLISLTGGEQRKVIGKFGIGKIASYTIGSQIFHICKSNQVFLSVGVDYDKLINNGSSDANIELQSADIFELTEEEAKTLLISVFETLPADFDGFFTKPSWTCAVIDQLKLNDLPIGRLKWVLGNGMPLKPQFSVYVNDVKIESNILKNDLACEWSFGQKEVVDQLTSKWNVAIERGEVKGEIKFGEEVGLDPDNINESIAYVELPNLNKVWGKIRLYKKSLLENRVNDYGRSHGFFIMVLGRLINQDDAQFFLNDPSFATFYSSQYILNVDGLDSDLLADRERVQETSIKSKELKVVQRAVYLALAAKQRKDVELMIDSQQIKHRLPVNSSEFFMQPLSALWIKSGSGETLGFDFKDPKIESVPLGAKSYVSAFSAKDGFTVNSDHPYYQNLTHLLGNSKQAQKVVKEFEVIAVSEKLFEGYLFELGIDEVSTGKIMFWRDEMYRKIAHSDNQTVYQLAQTLRETSYKTGAVFENAIVDILNSIGLIAYRDGAPGQKDVFVNAYCGDGSYKLTFEGKGCANGSVANDDAETGGANNHREAMGAECAIIVARKFAGFDKSDTPAILNECLSINNVSIMEVEQLIELAYSVKEYSYSIENLKEVFTSIESPKNKADRIKHLQQPFIDFNYSEFLEIIWENQARIGEGHAVALRTIWQTIYRDKGFSEKDILHKTEALRTLVFPLMQYDDKSKEVALLQMPENIIKFVKNKFE